MRPRILLFISILILNCFPVIADESLPPLPPLPVSNSEDTDSSEENDQIGFFGKAKSFLGFGPESKEDPKKAPEPSIAKVEKEKLDPDVELMPAPDDIQEDIMANTDEGPVSSQQNVPSMPESHKIDRETGDKLELPSGFEDVLGADKNALTSEDNIKDVPPGLPELPLPEDNPNLQLPSDSKGALEQKNVKDPQEAPEAKDPQEAPIEDPKDDDILSLPDNSATQDNSREAVPAYVPSYQQKEPEQNISKYKKEIKSKQAAPEKIEKISSEELAADNSKIEKFTDVTAADLDPKQVQFVNNEAQLLVLPNDEVVQGELSKDAKLNLIDFRLYAKKFWENYNWIKSESQREDIEEFIAKYDENFHEENYLYNKEEVNMALEEAFKAIDSNNIYYLIFLLDNYPILELTAGGGNNLLHQASYIGNYSAARFLLLKGINIDAKNDNNQTALDIAMKFGQEEIIFLLQDSAL